MKSKTCLYIVAIFIAFCFSFKPKENADDGRFVYFVPETTSQHLQLYWKNENGEIIRNFANLKSVVEAQKQELVFAMNGGMYKKDNSPQGLYIEDHQILAPLDTAKGYGNFYLQPNGVFYVTDNNKAIVCKTTDFKWNKKIAYATQSGPMLLIDGEIHPAFKKESGNLNVRNGVGILPDNRIIFAMSKVEVNFYELAMYFKTKGCKNALYLDGYVSRTYLPEQNWKQTDGNFGVLIGITSEKK